MQNQNGGLGAVVAALFLCFLFYAVVIDRKNDLQIIEFIYSLRHLITALVILYAAVVLYLNYKNRPLTIL